MTGAATPPPDGGPASVADAARLGLARVVGDSMRPTLRPGDLLLMSYRRRPVPGDVVLARFPDGTVVVKRAVERRERGWWLLSDAPDAGVDSRHRGAIAEADVLATALVRVWPRPGRLPAAPTPDGV